MTTLINIKKALPKLEWTISKDLMTVKFFTNGKSKNDEAIDTLLENTDLGINVSKLREIILTDARAAKAKAAQQRNEDFRGEISFIDLPLLESNLDADTDLTDADDAIWADLKFVKDDMSIFYIKDADANTYTAYLTAASNSDKSDVKTLKEAFYRHTSNRPEQIVKTLLKSLKVDMAHFDEISGQLPVTAWKYLKIKAHENPNGDVVWDNLVVPSGATDKLYQGVVNYEAELRTNGKHDIDEPMPLTNDANVPAMAYIDLDALDKRYDGKPSNLWDTFLLQRLHKPEYVSIFKAWSYSVAVGTNNSRQEMWLYGNGGTGKSCLCKSFIKGFNALANKDICLAASKDTGKSNFNSELLNKHLLVYPDAKNLKGGMSEFKHNATGGDYMRIEGKCKAATSAFIYLKCLTCSNELPKVDMTDRSQSSRYIVLPFTLDDDEMKSLGLMDSAGQMLGSATFQTRLDAEFNRFLASCKEHYEARCKTGSNIDAHEALGELAAIELDEVAVIEEFVNAFFEITPSAADRMSQKDFRTQCLYGIDFADLDTGIKPYKEVKYEAVRNYLEKKYDFRWKAVKINGKTVKAVTSAKAGIKIKSVLDTTESEDIFND
jgi:hypothetical protein